MARDRDVTTSDRDYVEKRLDKPGSFQVAAIYTAVVVGVAGVALAFFAFAARDSVYAAALIPTVLFLGGVGAFVQTYRVWKGGGGWAGWQGAGWFLMLVMLISLSLPGAAMMADTVQ
ncbi:MAG: hypothetical protein SW019_09870 [Actinomycetota bacterium]|nr:hypothetical protein [Actinomycetota bacterium]